MPKFTSPRERRLWFWAFTAITAIYSTIGLVGTLTGSLRELGLLKVSFGVGFALIIVSLLLSGLRDPSRAPEIWVGFGIAAVYGLVMVRAFTSIEERTHLIEYGIVAALIYQALLERHKNAENVPVPAILAIALTGIFGWIDEGIQAVWPDRVYDLRDIGFNALAGMMAVVSNWVLVWVRQRARE